jgi:hypothetical protein
MLDYDEVQNVIDAFVETFGEAISQISRLIDELKDSIWKILNDSPRVLDEPKKKPWPKDKPWRLCAPLLDKRTNRPRARSNC